MAAGPVIRRHRRWQSACASCHWVRTALRPARRRASTVSASISRSCRSSPATSRDRCSASSAAATSIPSNARAGSPTPASAPTTSSAPRCIAHRCTAARSRALVRATARPSRTRWCASPTRVRTRFSWSRKAWVSASSIRTASPPRCPSMCNWISSAAFRVWRTRTSAVRVTPSSTTISTLAACTRHWKPRRSPVCSLRARSTAPPATRKPALRA